MKLSTEKKIMDLENRLTVAWVEGKGVGWIGSLGLMVANYCFCLCIAENYVSIFTMEHNNGRKNYVYMYVLSGSPCCRVEEKKKCVGGNKNKK